MTIMPSPAHLLTAAGNHVWQSTVFAVMAALLVMALRRHGAHVRHGVWLAASLKFLLPFAPLVAVGGLVSWRAPEIIPAAGVVLAVEAISEPFSRTVATGSISAPSASTGWTFATAAPILVTIWAAGALAVAGVWIVRWARTYAAAGSSPHPHGGRESDLMRRVAARHGIRPISVAVADTTLEPGIFGIVHPVLLWPARLTGRLTDAQAEAIVAHELCHLRRRDNLAGAIHMIVQALFWFHPLVWWIGARLVDERERACDEEVVRRGSEPRAYAEGILTTCRTCIESRLACVPGVTGSSLKKRIEHILTPHAADSLTMAPRILLALAACATVAGPVALGAANPSRAVLQAPAGEERTLRFEVASVKPNAGDQMRVMQRFLPGGGFEAFNVTTGAIIRLAYRLQDFQMTGEPEWVHVDRFDVLTKGPDGAQQSEIAPRLKTLLADRFELKAHMATQDRPVYALVSARADGEPGPRLRPSAVDCDALMAERARSGAAPMPMPPPGQRPQCGTMRRPGGVTAGGMAMPQLAAMLAQFTGRMVVDRTGLTGGYDLDLDFSAEPPRPGAGLGGGLPPAARAPDGATESQSVSIFTALEEQLGLRLVSQTAPVDVLVVEQIERPTAD